MIDPEYLRWLEIYDPEAIPTDRYSLETAPSSTPFQASSSVVEHFSPLNGANITGSSTAIETSCSSCIHESHEVSVVAMFLTPIPVPSRPVKRSSGARVLTSEECLVMLGEKQLKKEKPKKSKSAKRNEKRRQKETEKKKAEERVRKAEERAKKRDEKQASNT